MITTLAERVRLKSCMRPWFHGCIETPSIRQSVNHTKKEKNPFNDSQKNRRITLKTIKTHHNQSKRPVTILNAQMTTALLHRCSYTSKYNAKTSFSCIWNQDLHIETYVCVCVRVCVRACVWTKPFAIVKCWTLGHKYSLLMHCIKIKSPVNFLLNEQYVFVGGNISFLCVLSCSSEEA